MLTRLTVGTALCVALTLPGAPAWAEDWSWKWNGMDYAMEAVFLIALDIDRVQTLGWKDEGYQEVGWAQYAIGNQPTHRQINQYALAAAIAHIGITWAIPHGPLRTSWQLVSVAVEINTVDKNYQLKASLALF